MVRRIAGMCFFIFCLSFACVFSASAATPTSTDWVTNPQLRVRIAVAPPIGSGTAPAQVDQFLQENLSFLPFATLVDQRAVPGGAAQNVASGPELDLRRFQLAGAHMLITTAWKGNVVELRSFDVTTGKFVFGNSYANVTANTAGDAADAFCADFMKALTGSGEFFRSTLAFAKTAGKTKKDIWSVRPTGRNLRRLTNMPGDALSPSWSRDGRFVIFSHVDVRTHGLGVWDSQTGQVQRIRFPGNTVIGPCFMPNNKVAVSLSTGKNPGIFLLDHQFRRESTIENSASIDVSPSVDASGTKMAFVSSRMGNPHIFLKDLRTGAVRRITYEGKYNTEPSISPDGTLVVFSRMVDGRHRIFVHDLVKQTESQISFGPGSDEQPAFAPDNYFIAFASTRSGVKRLYLTTRNGGDARLVPTGDGDAAFPAWGPVPK
ncbi:Protein TolB [uncultured delta proteobacterium]|uniref:Protein TolB n=1 Tax=uncultured delta proteobacterium TaxID=34034 RepID=A0A212JPH1_9DELT|nr:Protein TolB [uncultured delta proteobacterium]